jgi:hypothetical protein
MSYNVINTDTYKSILNDTQYSGTPTALTPSTNDKSTRIATTAFVNAQGYAKLNSPVFTGTPKAPTPTTGDNSTQIATTAFVKTKIGTSKYVRETGVYILNGSDGNNYASNINTIPVFYTCADMGDLFLVGYGYSNRYEVELTPAQSGTAVGKFIYLNALAINDFFIVHPGWGIVGYSAINHVGIVLNYKNTTSRVNIVKSSSVNNMRSIKIYYNDNEVVS